MVFIKPNKIEITKKWVEPIPKVAYNGCSYVECGKEIVISLSNTHEAKFLNFVFIFLAKSQIKKFGGRRKSDSLPSSHAVRITYRCCYKLVVVDSQVRF